MDIRMCVESQRWFVCALCEDKTFLMTEKVIFFFLYVNHTIQSILLNKLTEALKDVLRKSIDDLDESVALTALLAIIELDDQVFVPSKDTLDRLLSALNTFDAFGKSYLLRLLLRVRPEADKERAHLLNKIDAQLDAAEPTVVLATAAAMLHICATSPLLKSACQRVTGELHSSVSIFVLILTHQSR